jgi:mersacidin/lichenicidin family type 2 lantibiotic
MSGYEIVQSWKNDEYPLIASADRPEMLANPAGEIELAEDHQELFLATHHCPTIGGAFTCDGHFTCMGQ